ncbi:glycosyltransferase, partial [Methanoculleus chikugoensis]|uniref:glycosyltransferase n=1 Tax=Methanoculleus chikugoensis TaxID=118126 RepID=UPI001FB434E4
MVLVGNVATDDPEGAEVYRSLLAHRNERIIVKSVQDGALVNALQRRAAVVLQKSLREGGFGLTVSEAMWKGAAVIGGNVGGIRQQIEDGKSGFLVSSVDEAAERIVRLLRDPRSPRPARERGAREGAGALPLHSHRRAVPRPDRRVRAGVSVEEGCGGVVVRVSGGRWGGLQRSLCMAET